MNAGPVPPPPPPPLWSPFDAETYRSTLAEVYQTAARVRAGWQRLQRALLRADGVMLLGLAAVNLAQASQPASIAYPVFGAEWYLYVGMAIIGVFLIALTPQIQSWVIQRAVRRGRVPTLDLGRNEPTLGASVHVIGRMQKEWEGVYASLAVTVVMLLVTIAVGISFLFRGLPALLATPPAAATALWFASAVGLVVLCLLALALWIRDSYGRLRALEPAVRGVETRFRQLEWVFWQRY